MSFFGCILNAQSRLVLLPHPIVCMSTISVCALQFEKGHNMSRDNAMCSKELFQHAPRGNLSKTTTTSGHSVQFFTMHTTRYKNAVNPSRVGTNNIMMQ